MKKLKTGDKVVVVSGSNKGKEGKITKILDSKVKKDEIYVYVVANYGMFNENNNELSSVNSKKGALTMIYKKDKNNTGIYELKEYKEDEIPDNLKEKANVNFEDAYFKEQLNSYCNR